MVTRTEALAKAIEWATKAETAETRRIANLRTAADNDGVLNMDGHVRAWRETADRASIDRQTAIDMATMWTAIAAVLPGPQPYIAFTTPEEPQS